MTTDLIPRPMNLEEFLPLVGKPMFIDATPNEVRLQLIEASPGRETPRADRPPFILIFRSAPDVLLVDGIYKVRAEGFGPDLIAITSLIAPKNGEPGYYYQANFC